MSKKSSLVESIELELSVQTKHQFDSRSPISPRSRTSHPSRGIRHDRWTNKPNDDRSPTNVLLGNKWCNGKIKTFLGLVATSWGVTCCLAQMEWNQSHHDLCTISSSSCLYVTKASRQSEKESQRLRLYQWRCSQAPSRALVHYLPTPKSCSHRDEESLIHYFLLGYHFPRSHNSKWRYDGTKVLNLLHQDTNKVRQPLTTSDVCFFSTLKISSFTKSPHTLITFKLVLR